MATAEVEKKHGNSGGVVSPIVEVNPSPKNGLASKLIDLLEKVIVKLMYDTSQPLHYLSGNFTPVDETPPVTDLPVKGHLPVSSSFRF